MRRLLLLALSALMLAAGPARAEDSFSENEVIQAAARFFGGASEGLATVIEKAFRDHGRPTGYVMGEEASGAFGVGLRYGEGTLVRKSGGRNRVFWQGPSIGFDIGGNASKVFVLVYNLTRASQIYQRFPGVEGSIYVVAGFGMNYMQNGRIILAPVRTGVGLRAGANIGYLHFTAEKSLNPF